MKWLGVWCQMKQLEALVDDSVTQARLVQAKRRIVVDYVWVWLLVISANVCRAPIVSQRYYLWMNLDFFIRRVCHLLVRHGRSDQSWRSDSARPWRSRGALHIAFQYTARWRRKAASLFSCVSLARRMWLHWTVVLLLCQTWSHDNFDWIAIFRVLVLLLTRASEDACFEVSGKRKVWMYFVTAKYFPRWFAGDLSQ